MKKPILLALLLCACAAAVNAQQSEYVQPHYTANGTYVPGYWRTHRDNTPNDNYGYQGNYNPYNGNEGRQGIQTIDGVHGTFNGRQVINQGGRWYYVQ